MQLNFENVLAEPGSAHGFDFIWRLSFRIFTGTHSFIYKLLSALLSLPLALFWGIIFSLFSFFSIWLITPIFVMTDVFFFYFRRVREIILLI